MRLRTEKQQCIILCRVCGPFGKLQPPNYYKMFIEDPEKELRAATLHLCFCMEFCKRQSGEGRLFVSEHPAAAKPWEMQVAKNMLKLDDDVMVDVDFCNCGMKSERHSGEHVVKNNI